MKLYRFDCGCVGLKPRTCIDKPNIVKMVRFFNCKTQQYGMDDVVTGKRPCTPANSVEYRKSKVNLVYLDLPIELKLRWKNGFKLVPGFKVGYLIDSKQKYKGDRFDEAVMVKVKTKTIRQLEDWSYGFTLRVGYKIVSLYGYYQISNIFERGKGPEMNPISVGITITPF